MPKDTKPAAGEAAQLALDEKVIEDRELERMLADRSDARATAADARKAVRKIDAAVGHELEKLDIGLGAAVRIGPWRVERVAVKGRAVSFETGDSDRLAISLVE
jgi:hypothetical protein